MIATRPPRTAALSDDRRLRYALEQRLNHNLFAPTRGRVMFLMLNPSKADAQTDDLTFTKCMGFAERWGFQDLSVGNLYPVRETHPKDLFITGAPKTVLEYPEALAHLDRMAASARMIVCAWGGELGVGEVGAASVRILNHLYDLVPTTPFMCLGMTQDAYPRHPSRIAYDSELVPFVWYRRVRASLWEGPPWLRKTASPRPLSTSAVPVPYWMKPGTQELGAILGLHAQGVVTPCYVQSGKHLYKLYTERDERRGRDRTYGIPSTPATAAAELAEHPDWHRLDLVQFEAEMPICRYPTRGLDGVEEEIPE